MQERAILTDREHVYVAATDDPRIDVGVLLRVVVADPAGEQLLIGKPKLRVVREHRFGGMLDTRRRTLVGASKEPRTWYASEAQESILLHAGAPAAQLVEGAEGAGKTTVLAMWHYLQWVTHLGEQREGLQTAPTNVRLGLVRREIRKLWREEWFRYVARKDFVGYELADGSAIRMVSTHQQSEAQGSPVQGFNSSWAGRDETQDQTSVHDDIESRGREARDGYYPQLGTATVKDTPTYRNFRGSLPASDWGIRKLVVAKLVNPAAPLAIENLEVVTPFVTRAFVESKMRTMSEREFRRRYLAELLPDELAVFYGWDRARNLFPIPEPRNAIDVTAAILDAHQPYLARARSTLLVGHDPGNIWNTSVVLKLFLFPNPKAAPQGKPALPPIPMWCVVGELQTKQTTAHQHAKKLVQYLAREFGVNASPDSDRCTVFLDPHGKGETQTDYQTVYMAFQKEGLDVFNPAPMSKKIKRSSRIEMINRLCMSAAGESRFFVASTPTLTPDVRIPCAPVLVDALESLVKRPGDDDPEGTRKKDEDDKTHAPAALGYALWSFEQEALTEETQRRAIVAGGRR